MKSNKKILYLVIFTFFVIICLLGHRVIDLSKLESMERDTINKAKLQIQKGNYDLAEKKLEYILNDKHKFKTLSKDDKFDVLNYLGVINTLQGETVSALLMYEKADKYVSKINKYKVEMNTAIAYRQIGEYLKSAEILVKILTSKGKIDGDNARVKTYSLLNLAEIYLQIGNTEEYSSILEKVEDYIYDSPKEHRDDLLIIYYSDLIIRDIYRNNLDKVNYYFNEIKKLKNKNNEVYYTENNMFKTRAYAMYYEKIGEVEKAIKYFEKLEEYAQKEGDTFIAQFSIRERIEIYKRLGDKEKYNELLQEFYNKDQEILDINDKQYDFHLNNKILEQSNIGAMKKTVVLFILIDLILIAVVIFIYEKMRKSKTDSMRDALCNTYNRRYLESYKIKARKGDFPLTVLMIDVDYFKLYNDNYGHQKGDEVLKCISRVLKSSCRRNDIVFRYGGEEFCVVLKNTIKEEAIALAQRIKENVANEKIKHEYSKVDDYITLSMGITTVYSKENLRKSIALADKALYMSKESGRNKYTYI